MLVLSRKINESILIGDRIKITVVGLRGNLVRIGIEAPGEVTIMREELLVADAPAAASRRPPRAAPGAPPAPAPPPCGGEDARRRDAPAGPANAASPGARTRSR